MTGRTSSTRRRQPNGRRRRRRRRSGSRCSRSCSRWLPWCCSRCRRSPGCWCAGAAGADPATPAEQALAAWAELHDTLVDHGYDWDPADPPRRGAARLVGRAAPGGRAGRRRCDRVAGAVERARYAPEMPAVGDLRRRRRTRCGPRCPTARAGGRAGGPGCCRGRPARCPRRSAERMADGAGRASTAGLARCVTAAATSPPRAACTRERPRRRSSARGGAVLAAVLVAAAVPALFHPVHELGRRLRRAGGGRRRCVAAGGGPRCGSTTPSWAAAVTAR